MNINIKGLFQEAIKFHQEVSFVEYETWQELEMNVWNIQSFRITVFMNS